MSVLVYWLPPEDLTPTRFELYVVEAAERFVAAVPHQIPGPYWENTERRYRYEDTQGTDLSVYRVRSLGPNGELYGDTGPFQPSASRAAGMLARRRLDHDFGGVNALQYVTRSGVGVPQATIRVFKAVDWDQNRRDAPLFITGTDADGKWTSPIWVEPGFTYVLVFEKQGSFGPDVRRLAV